MFEVLKHSNIQDRLMYNIVIDENISFAAEAFEGFGNIRLLPGRSITRSETADADALIIRSVTQIDRELLEGSSVKFVGTATIGTDHIDLEYLKNRDIFFTSARGCNADAVAEWVFTALLYACSTRGTSLAGKSMGIIGYGNIGSRVARFAKGLGLRTVINDPPLQHSDCGVSSTDVTFSGIDEALSCDIVTLHVPLLMNGKYKTHHLINADNINLLRPDCIFINAARGPVVDNSVLEDYMKTNPDFTALLDVWEHEPGINPGLMDMALAATPHVAGYSLEGKVNGTAIIYEKFCGCFRLTSEWVPRLHFPDNNVIAVSEPNSVKTAPASGFSREDILHSVFSAVYNIQEDTQKTKEILSLPAGERALYFDRLRKNYLLRREFFNYTAKTGSDEIRKILELFRFRTA